jgi:hypothetical protein
MPVAYTRPGGRLVAPVLVPYLDDWYATAVALWTLTARQHRTADRTFAIPRNRLHLTEPERYPGHGLRWEFVDLGCERNPDHFGEYESRRPAFLAVLAAAALHPRWVLNLVGWGSRCPSAWLTGLRCEKAMLLLTGGISPPVIELLVRNYDPDRFYVTPVLLDYM